MCAGAYRPMAAVLGSSFHVWALDFRAHGCSTMPAGGGLGWPGMIDDVLATVDALGGGPVAAFGHSMGGACLMGAELRRPGTIARAFLFEPIIVPAGFDVPGRNPMADAARRRRADVRLPARGAVALRQPAAARHLARRRPPRLRRARLRRCGRRDRHPALHPRARGRRVRGLGQAADPGHGHGGHPHGGGLRRPRPRSQPRGVRPAGGRRPAPRRGPPLRPPRPLRPVPGPRPPWPRTPPPSWPAEPIRPTTDRIRADG